MARGWTNSLHIYMVRPMQTDHGRCDSDLGVGVLEAKSGSYDLAFGGIAVTRVLGSRYVLSSVIGRGAMGEVWEGRSRTDDDERVAVKILRPELADDASLIVRFLQERSILVGLSGPHLVELRDLVLEGGTLAIVMEYVAGSDLRKYLNRYGTLRPALAVRLVAQICEGLALVHAAGIVHRDIKPENVLLDLTDPAAPIAKVTDFGVSRITYGPRLTRLTGLIGTPEYIAPEVAEHDTATPAADMYSVGILLYELLAGRTPFAGGHPLAVLKRHVEAPPPPIDGIPGLLWSITESLLAKDPDRRPSDAAVVSERLMDMSSGLDDVEAAPPQEPPGPTGVTPSWLSPLPRELDATTQLRGVNKPIAELSANAGIGDRRGLVPDSEAQSEPNETRLGIRCYRRSNTASGTSTSSIPEAAVDQDPATHGARISGGKRLRTNRVGRKNSSSFQCSCCGATSKFFLQL